MDYTLIERMSAETISFILFAGMILMFLLGRAIGKKWTDEKLEEKSVLDTFRTAILGLFGFLLAFGFGMSGNRYENARNVLIEESNEIGTAILRADLYADSTRSAMRVSFKNYLDARMELYSDLNDGVKISEAQMRMDEAGKKLWKLATSQSKLPNMFIPSNQMIPALNAMFDAATTREVYLITSIPDIVVYVLLLLGFLASLLVGLSSPAIRMRERIGIFFFAFFSALVVYLTIDLGRPLHGAIRVHTSEQAINNLQKLFIEPGK
ncbi:MAG TPA: hypothetical protein VMH01_01605 [Puia sp.]|nr:hypothetical protein [Puia sp.]